jgi:Flp pilus assembly protein TadD
MNRFLAGTTLVLASALGMSAAERTWTQTRTPHFLVVSDAGEKACRTTAWQMEQVRAALLNIWPWARGELGKPVEVIAVRDENSMKALAPAYWEQKSDIHPASVFVPGVDRYFIAVRTDALADDKQGINPYQTAFFSYAGLVIRAGIHGDMPLWFYRGLSGVMSNTIVRDSYLEVGRTIPWHLRILRSSQRLKLPELMAVDQRSPWYTELLKREVFDAECWAFVHYLIFGDKGVHQPALNQFISLLVEGKSAVVAQDLAFKDLNTLTDGFAVYLGSELHNYSRVEADLRLAPEGFATERLPAAESATARAAFHAAMRRPIEARVLVADAQKADPHAASPFEVEGTLLDSERKANEARSAYDQAIELGSTNFYAYYRAAALAPRTGAAASADERARAESLLDRSIKLNAAYAPAPALLAEVRVRGGHPDGALELAQRAVSLEPSQASHRLTLAHVLWAAGRHDEALREARGAMTLAATDQERQNVQQVITLFEKGGN